MYKIQGYLFYFDKCIIYKVRDGGKYKRDGGKVRGMEGKLRGM